MDVFQKRRQRLRQKMQEQGLQFLLISGDKNRYYLSGFELSDPQCNESAGFFLLGQEEICLFTDPRYEQTAEDCLGADSICVYRQNKAEKIRDFLHERKIKNLHFEPLHLSCETYFQLQKEGVTLNPAPRLFVEEERMIKDEEEIKALERSCSLNHKVFEQVQDYLYPGIKESELAWEVEKLFRSQGAEELSFSTIAAFGKKGALPHAVPGERVLKENDCVLLDMGCRMNGYCSDQSRSFLVGEVNRFKEVISMVQEAQKKAIEEIKPGMEIKEAYALARECFRKYGEDNRFIHALGHGIGLETHEPPSLSPLAEGVFKPGMVVTVEPGLYYPHWGGVRWEHMVHVQENGARVL